MPQISTLESSTKETEMLQNPQFMSVPGDMTGNYREISPGQLQSPNSFFDRNPPKILNKKTICYFCKCTSRLSERSPVHLFVVENGESVLVHSSCHKAEKLKISRSVALKKRTAVQFSPTVKVIESSQQNYAPPPNLVDFWEDGGIDALHKHTGLPFTYEHFPVSSIDLNSHE
jgi:hypothetical protein